MVYNKAIFVNKIKNKAKGHERFWLKIKSVLIENQECYYKSIWMTFEKYSDIIKHSDCYQVYLALKYLLFVIIYFFF